jgi:rhodanese-related sulfurtransferase
MFMAGFRDLLKQTKSQIQEIAPNDAEARLGDATFLDVRELDEYEQGMIPGAVFIPRGHLESQVENKLTNHEAPIVVYCAGGTRSAFAAKTLDSFNKALERQGQVLASLIKQQEQLRQTLEKTHAGGGGGGGGAGGGGGSGSGTAPLGFWGTAGAVGAGTFGGQALYGLLQRLVDAGGAAMRGSFSEAAMRAVPFAGPLAADTAAGAQRYYQVGVAADQARMGAYGHTALSRAAMDRAMRGGARMGIDPLQMPGMMVDFATQTGMQGDDLSRIAPLLASAGRFGARTTIPIKMAVLKACSRTFACRILGKQREHFRNDPVLVAGRQHQTLGTGR